MKSYDQRKISELSTRVKVGAYFLMAFFVLQFTIFGFAMGSAAASATQAPPIITGVLASGLVGIFAFFISKYIFAILLLLAESALCLSNIEGYLAVLTAKEEN